MPDRPKNERDIVKPTVNICAAVIFFVWACPQRVPPFFGIFTRESDDKLVDGMGHPMFQTKSF